MIPITQTRDLRPLPALLSMLPLFIGIILAGQATASSPGALDLSFGIAGVTSKNLGADSQETRALAVQPDGKILMVGKKAMNSPTQHDFLLIRYNADGTLDTGFGTNGVVVTDFDGDWEVANAVAVQADGKILVGGTWAYGPNHASTGFLVARYLTNGSLDTTFGNDGRAGIGILDFAIQRANMLVQPDGKIFFAGDDLNTNLVMTRFTSNGGLDSGFGDGGAVAYLNTILAETVGILSNGKIIAAGWPANGTDSVTVYGFNSDGSPDTNFGTNGKFTRRYTTSNGFFLEVVQTKLAIQPDDKIIVSGNFHSGSQADYANVQPPLLRLNPNGTPDSGFAPNANITNISLSPCSSCTSEVRTILPMANGKFYAVGFSGDFDTSFRGISVSRYHGNGTFDNSFGLRGTRYIRKIDWTHSVTSALLQPDGKIVLGATGTTNFIESGNIAYDYLVMRLNTSVGSVTPGDFDGDRRTDLAVFRPSDRNWYVLNSSDSSVTTTFYGISTDSPIPGDYNYDGRTDLAQYRSSGSGFWIKPSQPGNGSYSTSFGSGGDIPVPADYDGDGLADVATFRPSIGTWYLRYSSMSLRFPRTQSVPFGLSGDKPVPADYDGDGLTDVAIFRPSTGVWWILRSSDEQVTAVAWGLSTDRPVQADYDGDGKADLAVFREGVWYVLRSSDGSALIQQWGLSDDVPVAGDYDGDGRADLAVFRPSEGNWYAYKSSDATFLIAHWGSSGDIPIPARYFPN